MDLKFFLKMHTKILQDVLNGLTFCYYSYKQVHVEHPTDSAECRPHEGIVPQITVRYDFEVLKLEQFSRSPLLFTGLLSTQNTENRITSSQVSSKGSA